MRYPDFIEQDFRFPDFYRVEMRYPHDRVSDVAGEVRRTLAKVLPSSGIKSGDRVAIGVGSRGIANLPEIVRTLCSCLAEAGAKPFIIPAMGSHGGATDAGQFKVLAKLGISEASVGVPIRSSLAAEQVDSLFGEAPLFYAKDALQADHSICVNRIKPHTKFKAAIESGLCKMLTVGMGKHAGALAFHDWALKYGFSQLLKAATEQIVAKTNFRFGLAIVEDSYDETAHLEAIPAADIVARESALLEKANGYFPRLPVQQLDALVVGTIGKELSGSGMDPNVTGRTYDLQEDDFSGILTATRVAVLRLSEQTAGNAIGVGNADFITEQLFQQIDYQATLMNALTSRSLRKAYIPIRLPSEQKAIQACFTTIGPRAAEQVRAIIIRDTLHLTEFWASAALREELQQCAAAAIRENAPLAFDATGRLALLG